MARCEKNGCAGATHKWPDSGDLTICSGERYCRYCPASAKRYDKAYNIRKHVYERHIHGGLRDKTAVVLLNYA